MARRVYVVKESKGDGWLVLLLAALIVAYSGQLIIIGLILFAIYALIKLPALLPRRSKEQKAISTEPYVEDSIYGAYTPATMPLTYPICNTFPYRDIDDGMRNWK